ncbi:MAG: hypothetical protein HY644_01625 [Acidobacteria bacterium]|nr:hypothetical protein [Acidobacteriota bacterium]
MRNMRKPQFFRQAFTRRYRFMLPVVCWLIIGLLMGGAKVMSEEPRFVVCYFDIASNKFIENWWSGNMLQWWKDSQKKPGSKLSARMVRSIAEADFIVIWIDATNSATVTYTIPVQHPITANVNVLGPGGLGTVYGTVTTNEQRSMRLNSWQVTASVHLASDGKLLFTQTKIGKWRWSKPDKDVLLGALNFISTNGKSLLSKQSAVVKAAEASNAEGVGDTVQNQAPDLLQRPQHWQGPPPLPLPTPPLPLTILSLMNKGSKADVEKLLGAPKKMLGNQTFEYEDSSRNWECYRISFGENQKVRAVFLVPFRMTENQALKTFTGTWERVAVGDYQSIYTFRSDRIRIHVDDGLVTEIEYY